MSNIYLPDPIYDRLPKIYFVLAVLTLITPLGPVKWPLIIGLVAATFIVSHWRRTAREAEQARTAAAIMEKYRLQHKDSPADKPDSYEI